MPHRRRWQLIGRGIRTAQADLLSVLLICSPIIFCPQAVQVVFINKTDARPPHPGTDTYRFATCDINSNGLLALTRHCRILEKWKPGMQYKAGKGETG